MFQLNTEHLLYIKEVMKTEERYTQKYLGKQYSDISKDWK